MPAADQQDLELIRDHALEAGRIAMGYFKKDNEVWWKEGNSPVSEADFAVDSFLREKLLEARPDYGWLSEETDDDLDRLETRRTFVVDPIDGTRGFINGMDKWCVSIAVVEQRRPIAAVLESPVLSQTVMAGVGQGAMMTGTTICAVAPRDPLVMTGPRTFLDELSEGLEEKVEKSPFVPSLAWRLAMVAIGDLDVALARASARDWDLAAADLIVHEAGAVLTDLNNQPLTYNCRSTRHGALVASHVDRHEEMLDLARLAMNKKND